MDLSPEFLTRLQQDYPHDYAKRLAAFSDSLGVSVNRHPRKYTAAFRSQALPWNESGILLQERPAFVYDPWFHGGAYYVQEAGSQLAGKLFSMLEIPEHPLVLDLCAAPGGKTVHLANLLAGRGVLVSNEPIKTRVGVLQENLSKAGWDNCIITQSDPSVFQGLEALFDVILVDAPCSGEGMFRKSEEAREHWSPDLVRFCAARQHRLLEDIWPALKPGGFLLYSTCTLNQQENEAQLDALLKHPDAKTVAVKLPDTWGLAEGKSDTSCWYNWPGNAGGEGFFLGLVQKKGQADEQREPSKTSSQKRKETTRPVWLADTAHLVDMEGSLFAISEAALRPSGQLKPVRVIHAGTRVGAFIGNKFKPDPELALSVHFNTEKTAALSLDEALAFLCGDGIMPETATEGWNAVSYEGLPLGWINHLGKRSNNLWPAPWRIRQRPKGNLPMPFWQT